MAFKQQIQEALKESMRSGDSLSLGVLRMLLASLIEKEREKREKLWKEDPSLTEEQLQEKSILTDEEAQSIVMSEAKKRRDAIQEYEKGGRPELAQKEKEELSVLERYLPQQLSEEEVRELVDKAIADTSASGPQDMGKVMGALMPSIRGRADGNAVQKIVQEKLSALN